MNRSVSCLIKPVLLMATFLLWGCQDSSSSSEANNGGGGDSTGSLLTVEGRAEANGEITPSIEEVAQNEIVTFTVKPDDGFAIESVTGCGGTLEDSDYKTAEIIENCVVIARFSPIAEVSTTMEIGQRYQISDGDEVVTLSVNPAQIKIVQFLDDNSRYVTLVAGEAKLEWRDKVKE